MKIAFSQSSFSNKLNIVIVVALLLLVGVFQKKHDDFGPPFTTKLSLAKRNLLPPTILPYITFGYDNIIADFYWIRAIQDFVAWNGKEGFYIGYFRNIATLDPRFEYPYLFSILTIPQNQALVKDIGPLDEVAKVAEKGIEAIPTSWKIPFYLGTQYYLFTKKFDLPEHYLAIAASRKGAPDGVYLVYTSFITKKASPTKDKEYSTSRDLISVIYNNTDNEIIKSLAGKGIQINYITQLLDKGIPAYKAQYHRYPKYVYELLAVHFIALPDVFLENFDIQINLFDGSFKITEKKEG